MMELKFNIPAKIDIFIMNTTLCEHCGDFHCEL